MSLVVVKTCRMFLKLNRFRTSIYAVRSTPPNWKPLVSFISKNLSIGSRAPL